MSGCSPNESPNELPIELAHEPPDARIDVTPDSRSDITPEPQEPRPMMTATRRTARVLVAAAIAVAAVGGPTAAGGDSPSSRPGSAPASTRPWLEVKLPSAPAAGAPTAKLKLRLAGTKLVPSEYAGLRVAIDGGAVRTVPLGDRVELVIAASATTPYRFEIGGVRVLAHVHAGDTLAVHQGHDGGWVALIGSRTNEDAPRALTRCAAQLPRGADCPAGFVSTRVFEGDRVCAEPIDDEPVYKCVQAPVVRARGPLTGRAEVTLASASGKLDEPETVSLAPRPLAPRALGPSIAVAISSEAMPMVRIGGAEALLVVGPGGAYEVWLDPQGRIDSAELAPR